MKEEVVAALNGVVPSQPGWLFYSVGVLYSSTALVERVFTVAVSYQLKIYWSKS